MEDLIKREDAIKAEADRVYKVLHSEGCKETYEECLADAEKTFKDIPSAEPKANMAEDDAFYIVYKDLTKDEGVFTGRYDAKNGSEKYMHGVCSVMEYIAYKVGEDCYDAFNDRFIKNMIESEEKAERSKR